MELKTKIDIKNRRAFYDFEIIDKYDAGIVLKGTEIKSIRMGRVSLVDCFGYFHNGELYIKGVNISTYEWASYNNHIPKRDRKLLLNKKELKKLDVAVKEKGLSIVGLRMFLNSDGFAKLEIALCKGRKDYDKRDYIKEKDMRRENARYKIK